MPRNFQAELLRSVLGALRQHMRPLLAFALLFSIFTLWLAGPAVTWLIHQLYKTSGDSVVSNYDILSYLLTPGGSAVALLFLIGLLVETAARRAGFVVICSDAAGRDGRAALIAFRGMFRRLHRMATVALLQVAWVLLGTLPLMVVGYLAYRRWVTQYDLTYFLQAHPPGYTEMKVTVILLASIFAALMIWVYLRCFFVVPLAMLTGCAPREALRQSAILGRGFHRYLLQVMAVATALGWIVFLALEWVGKRGVDLMLGLFPDHLVIASGLSLVLLVLSGLAVVVAAFLALALEAALVVHLFRMRRPEFEPPADLRAGSIRIAWWTSRSQTTRRGLVWGLAALTTLIVVGAGWSKLNQTDLNVRPQIMAHRGASRVAPENTLSAIRKAIDAGANWVEIDVQLTADSQIVLYHDRDLMRMCGDTSRITSLTREQLSRFDVGGWFAPEFAGERIPTLGEAIETVSGRAGLNIELKYVDTGGTLVRRVVQTVQDAGFTPKAIITSYTYSELEAVRRLDTAMATGLIVAAALGNTSHLDVSALNIEEFRISRSRVRDAHARGLMVISGTVDNRRDMERLIHLGVDYIMTNRPDVLAELLAERDELTAVQILTLNVRHLIRER